MPAPAYPRCERLPDFVHALRRGGRRWLCCFGDSNTANAGFTDGAKQWPELVHTALKDAAGAQTLMLANAGVSGDTTADALARFEHDVARVRPDLTLLCFGTNDAGSLDDAAFVANLHALIDRLLALGGEVVLRTPAPVWERSTGRIWRADLPREAKRKCVRELAAARQLPLIDTHALWEEAEERGELDCAELMADEVHTNAAGHRLVARQILVAFGVAA